MAGSRPRPTPPAERVEGFAPIEEYAVLGDGRTVALVARDGSVDWWPIPTLDAPPLCAALLDPGSGGRFVLAPEPPFDVSRRYVAGTNVLQSELRTPGGVVRVTDSLDSGSAGSLPWTELARRVEGVDGQVTLHWVLEPGDRFGEARPWVSTRHGVPVVHLGDQSLAVVVEGAAADRVDAHRVGGTLTVGAGDRQLVAVVATDDEPLFVPSADAVHDRIDATIRSWQRWSAQIDSAGPWHDAVVRSALALEALRVGTGAIAAAATTSLPERIGGDKNWDYRYAWVRDSSFALDALIRLHLHEGVHASVSWLLGAIRASAPRLEIFYRLDGSPARSEASLDVPGYRHSLPVRAGNSASSQLQLGNFGDLFDTVARYVGEGHFLDPRTGELLAGLADRCCDLWMHEDSGIWELPDLQHYTISKMACWVALRHAVALAERGDLPARHAERWAVEAEDVARWVRANCWSEAKQAYTFHAGTEDLDAAVLLAGRTGFDRGARLSSTIDALSAELRRGPFVYRFSGMEREEGAFVACSFWMVSALTHVGRTEEAGALMAEMVGAANDVGLFSEQIDPASRAFLGNVPQGLSHMALINAAHTLGEVGAVGEEP